MTVDARPDPPSPLTRVQSVLDDAPWDLEPAVTVTSGEGSAQTVILAGWVPPVPEPEHSCPDGVCADMAKAFNLDEQAADERSREAWARTMQVELLEAMDERAEQVEALRAVFAAWPVQP